MIFSYFFQAAFGVFLAAAIVGLPTIFVFRRMKK